MEFRVYFLSLMVFMSVLAAERMEGEGGDAVSPNIDEEPVPGPETVSADFSGEDLMEEASNDSGGDEKEVDDRELGDEFDEAMDERSGGKNETQNSTLPTKSLLRKIRCKQRVFKPWPEVSPDVNENLSLNEKSKELLKNMEDLVNEVKLVNGSFMTQLFSEKHNPNITNKSTPAECHLAMFYAPWCPFSAAAAPHFNALARLYPDVTMLAVDSSNHQGINTQFGILAIPTLILFHNSKPISKFNHTEYNVHNFVEYMDTFTHMKPVTDVLVTEEDMAGPLPTVAAEVTDYYLYLAWIFTAVCAIGYFGKSSLCAKIVETFRNNWREAEIQHEHID